MDNDQNFDFEYYNDILQYYQKLLLNDITEYEKCIVPLILPTFPIKTLTNMLRNIRIIFQSEPSLLKINSKVVIIGDLHGHILDLFRILKKFGFPPSINYLFLGDIVDRGDFSTETVVLVFILKILYPNNVFIIRGNHEFSDMCKSNGFSNELLTLYEDKIVENEFYDTFSYIPFGALINNNILCVHGGIGPTLTNIEQILLIKRPLISFSDETVLSLTWSDPSDYIHTYQISPRGLGYFFGNDSLLEFLNNNNLNLLIRGHECVHNGTEYQLNKKMITVFSASNYCGISDNNAGTLTIYPDGHKEFSFFPPLKYLNRSQVSFYSPELINLNKKKNSLNNSLLVSDYQLPLLNSKSVTYSQKHVNRIDSGPIKRPKRAYRLSDLQNKSSLLSPIKNIL